MPITSVTDLPPDADDELAAGALLELLELLELLDELELPQALTTTARTTVNAIAPTNRTLFGTLTPP